MLTCRSNQLSVTTINDNDIEHESRILNLVIDLSNLRRRKIMYDVAKLFKYSYYLPSGKH